MRSVSFGNPKNAAEIRQILELQRVNLPSNISEEELRDQGFVTVRHDEPLLTDMHAAEPQIIARDGDRIVGYALVMLPSFADRIPVLQPMFRLLETLDYRGQSLQEYNYYIIGQICVAKDYRGQGVVEGLYRQHREQLSGRYDLTITEISDRNQRSLRAHHRIGFETIHRYTAPDGELWHVIAWDWKV